MCEGDGEQSTLQAELAEKQMLQNFKAHEDQEFDIFNAEVRLCKLLNETADESSIVVLNTGYHKFRAVEEPEPTFSVRAQTIHVLPHVVCLVTLYFSVNIVTRKGLSANLDSYLYGLNNVKMMLTLLLL